MHSENSHPHETISETFTEVERFAGIFETVIATTRTDIEENETITVSEIVVKCKILINNKNIFNFVASII